MTKQSEELKQQVKMVSLLNDTSKMLEGVLAGGYYHERVTRFRTLVIPTFKDVHLLSDSDVLIAYAACDVASNFLTAKKEASKEQLKEKVQEKKSEVDEKIEELKKISAQLTEELGNIGNNLDGLSSEDVQSLEGNIKETLSFIERMKQKWKDSKLREFFVGIGKKLKKLKNKIKLYKQKHGGLLQKAEELEHEEEIVTPMSNFLKKYPQGSVPPNIVSPLPEVIERQVESINAFCEQVQGGNPPDILNRLLEQFELDRNNLNILLGKPGAIEYHWGNEKLQQGHGAVGEVNDALVKLQDAVKNMDSKLEKGME